MSPADKLRAVVRWINNNREADNDSFATPEHLIMAFEAMRASAWAIPLQAFPDDARSIIADVQIPDHSAIVREAARQIDLCLE